MSIKHVTFDNSGTIAYSSLTNAYQTVLTLSDDADIVFLFNSTDAANVFRVPNGSASTKELRLPAYSSLTLDCRSNSKRIAKGLIEVKYVAAPTIGEVTVIAAR